MTVKRTIDKALVSQGETAESSDYVEFFKAVRVRADCPMCGNKVWTIFENPPEGRTAGLTYLARGEDKPPLQMFVRVIIASCNRCGFIRHHDRAVFLRWQRRQQGKK